LQDVDQGIFPPDGIEVWGGLERNQMASLGVFSQSEMQIKSAEKGLVIINFPQREIRFFRLKAKNIGALPSNHPLSEKGKAMLYIDEIAIN
jgi:hypothetical protein